MINFKRQKFFALIYISFLSSLICANQEELNNDDMPNQEHYKKCSNSCDHLKSCDHAKSCDHRRSRDCCHHKKDVKSYEKKLGIIRGSVGFGNQVNALNATVSIASTPISGTTVYPATITPTAEVTLVKKGKCFKTDGFSFGAYYLYKSIFPGLDIIEYFTFINIKFNKRFKNPPTITVTEQDTQNFTGLSDALIQTVSSAIITPCLYFVKNVTTTGCTLARQCITYLPTFTGSPSAIKMSSEAQTAVSLDISDTNISFIATGEICD